MLHILHIQIDLSVRVIIDLSECVLHILHIEIELSVRVRKIYLDVCYTYYTEIDLSVRVR